MRRVARMALFAALVPVACAGPTPKPRSSADAEAHHGSPLGASYVLLPLPGEDDALLGRVLLEPPEAGRSLEETARPNPCADKLAEAKTTPLAATFEDAEELSAAAKARAMLGAYGFEGDAEHASHFIYKLEVAKKIGRADTTDYVACCKDKGCGYGYVSALIYGDGEYATGQETRAEGKVDVVLASGGGEAHLKVIHKRKVKGWLAAMITVTDPSKTEQLGPLGAAKAAGITEATVPEQVKKLYEAEKISVATHGTTYVFTDGHGAEVTENEFVRRFRQTTGSREIDDVEKRHNTPGVTVWGLAGAASAGVLLYGVTHLHNQKSCNDGFAFAHDECKSDPSNPRAQQDNFGEWYDYSAKYPETNGFGIAMAALGGVGLATSLAFLVPKLLDPDGSPKAHYLTERDAHLYAERFNRSLLRKTVKDVERNQRQTAIAPARPVIVPGPALQLRPGGLGFSTTF